MFVLRSLEIVEPLGIKICEQSEYSLLPPLIRRLSVAGIGTVFSGGFLLCGRKCIMASGFDLLVSCPGA